MTGGSREWRVAIGQDEVAVLHEPASLPVRERVVFVCAHGAGGHGDDPRMAALAVTLRGCGLDLVRFNFPYRERGSGRPDPMPVLEASVAAVAASARAALQPRRLILGGRSMGGRAASMLGAQGFACDALLLFAYPLHPAGTAERLRDAHLARIPVPVLCFNGTRDALCRQDLMQAALQRVGMRWTMHWLDGADHSFHVLNRSGRTDAQVLDEVGATTRAWLDRLRA